MRTGELNRMAPEAGELGIKKSKHLGSSIDQQLGDVSAAVNPTLDAPRLEADEIHLDIQRCLLVVLVGGGQVIPQLSHH